MVDEPPRKRARSVIIPTQIMLLEQQLETVQAELDHERSLRSMDRRQAEEQSERLEQQVASAVRQAKIAKETLDETRRESQVLTTKLRNAKDSALEQVRNLQQQHMDMQLSMDDEDYDYKVECHRMKQLVTIQTGEIKDLQAEAQDLRRQLSAAHTPIKKEELDNPVKKEMEVAPPQIMNELRRIRTQFSDAERKWRISERSLASTERRLNEARQEREKWKQMAAKVPELTSSVAKLQKIVDDTERQRVQWKSWEGMLRPFERLFDGPPEVATVIRTLEAARREAQESSAALAKCHEEYTRISQDLLTAEKKCQEFGPKELEWTTQTAKLESQLREKVTELQSSQARCAIYQREAAKLTGLIESIDGKPGTQVQIAADAARQDVVELQAQVERLNQQTMNLTRENKELDQEVDRVKEKYGKLRDALEAEKQKVAAANQRACQAESLAGKGAFDSSQTRVLHFEETPLVTALRNEVKVLKKQCGEKPGGQQHHDPEKLNQRLKQSFKEQIALFREGVYLMTGFKVDMLPATSGDRPTFRVRSIFAEREEDHLMLKWPKQDAGRMDILSTDLAKLLATTPSYDYMKKFQSLPAFLASVQLSLFEKQTVLV